MSLTLAKILMFLVTNSVCKKMAAVLIERGVKSTKTKLDDDMAEPVLKFLRDEL